MDESKARAEAIRARGMAAIYAGAMLVFAGAAGWVNGWTYGVGIVTACAFGVALTRETARARVVELEGERGAQDDELDEYDTLRRLVVEAAKADFAPVPRATLLAWMAAHPTQRERRAREAQERGGLVGTATLVRARAVRLAGSDLHRLASRAREALTSR